MLSTELWKPIRGFEGLYEVSSLGEVRSIDRFVNGFRGRKLKKGKECKQFIRHKYLSVGLSKNNKVKFCLVHILVAQAFVPNPDNKPTVNHKYGNILINAASGLEWATMSEQITHAIDAGLFNPIPPTKKGDKLSEETKRKMAEARKGKKFPRKQYGKQ